MTDFGNDDWLLLVEDSGPDGLGRILGFFVFKTETEAKAHDWKGLLCDALGLFQGENIPEDVVTEIMTYRDFRESYGNRMPLRNRGNG
jgi:hypothetical protein